MSATATKKLPLALCPSCSTPLISTLVFPQCEFYCLNCGNTCGLLDPSRSDPADRDYDMLNAVQNNLAKEWDDNAGSKLLSNSWYPDCELCKPHKEYHPEHADAEEWQADKEARAWLVERISR